MGRQRGIGVHVHLANASVVLRFKYGKRIKMKFKSTLMFGVICAISFVNSGFGKEVETAAEGTAKPTAGQVKSLLGTVEDLVETFGEKYANGEKYYVLAKKMAIEAESGSVTVEAFKKLQRDALTANPLLSSQPIVYTVHAQDTYGTHIYMRPWTYKEQGSQLKILDIKTGKTRTLVSTKEGIIRRPCVNFDGRGIVFSMSKNLEDNFHIYEIALDDEPMIGTGKITPKQLTFAPDVSDVDPIYLPGGGIAFCSTRDIKYVPCDMMILPQIFRMEGDGANIHQITRSTVHENEISLMPDGRILYSRWDYVDRNFGDGHGFWVTNPDGTNQSIAWGNNTAHPSAGWSARAIPGTGGILCVLGTHHGIMGGALAILDTRKAIEGRDSIVRTWPANTVRRFENLPVYHKQKSPAARYVTRAAEQWPKEAQKLLETDPNMRIYKWTDALGDVRPWYNSPWPLSDKYFLCVRSDKKFDNAKMYLVDTFGNEVEIHSEESGIYCPIPLAKQSKPTTLPPRRDYANNDGIFYIQNVYEGSHMQGVEPGSVKHVRVVEAISKRGLSDGYWLGLGIQLPAMNWTDFNAKRILGTAIVEKDGSASFYVPSDRYLYFQLLDENGMMIQSMRSGTSIHSGETLGCVGCHESRPAAGSSSYVGKFTIATKRAPEKLSPWYGAEREFSYATEVQPVFDKYCVKCHDFDKDGGKKLLLCGDKTPAFNVSYMELWNKGYTGSIGAGPAAHMPAKSWGSHTSKLIGTILAGHKEIELDKESLDRLVTWVDINGPYYPTSYAAFNGHRPGRIPLNRKQTDRLLELVKLNRNMIDSVEAFEKPMISFDRPTLSPCLERVEKDSPQYKEALAIIQSGKAFLETTPRADMPGFEPFEKDARRQMHHEKYLGIEKEVRKAILSGEKIYDTQTVEAKTMGL
jgi:hypothetical protein